MPKGILIILSAPSGTGKSTICRKLLQKRKNLKFSVSCTTRSPRAGEKNATHYLFVSKDEFKRKIRQNEFLEWALVHDEYYGTPRQFIENTIKKGLSVLLAIDVQGAAAIRRKIPDSILIFVAPPSLESLRERLVFRHEDLKTIEKRLANSKEELAAAKNYDYLVINDNLKKAVFQVECILTAESLRLERQEILNFKALV